MSSAVFVKQKNLPVRYKSKAIRFIYYNTNNKKIPQPTVVGFSVAQ